MPTIEDENASTSAGGKGRNPRLPVAVGASKSTASQNNLSPREHQLMEEVLTKENMTKAMKRVEANKGAAGMDVSWQSKRGMVERRGIAYESSVPDNLF